MSTGPVTASQAAMDALDAPLANLIAACPDAQPDFEVSTVGTLRVGLHAIANTWTAG